MGQGYLCLHVDDADKFVSLQKGKTAMQQAGQGIRIQISQISVIIDIYVRIMSYNEYIDIYIYH